jgi:hypothetical protein
MVAPGIRGLIRHKRSQAEDWRHMRGPAGRAETTKKRIKHSEVENGPARGEKRMPDCEACCVPIELTTVLSKFKQIAHRSAGRLPTLAPSAKTAPGLITFP